MLEAVCSMTGVNALKLVVLGKLETRMFTYSGRSFKASVYFNSTFRRIYWGLSIKWLPRVRDYWDKRKFFNRNQHIGKLFNNY